MGISTKTINPILDFSDHAAMNGHLYKNEQPHPRLFRPRSDENVAIIQSHRDCQQRWSADNPSELPVIPFLHRIVQVRSGVDLAIIFDLLVTLYLNHLAILQFKAVGRVLQILLP